MNVLSTLHPHLNIPDSSTRSHTSGEENRSKNCKCKRAFTIFATGSALTDHEMVEIHYNKITSLQV
jgi:hypothetical protein